MLVASYVTVEEDDAVVGAQGVRANLRAPVRVVFPVGMTPGPGPQSTGQLLHVRHPTATNPRGYYRRLPAAAGMRMAAQFRTLGFWSVQGEGPLLRTLASRGCRVVAQPGYGSTPFSFP